MWIFYSRVVDKATCRTINYTLTFAFRWEKR